MSAEEVGLAEAIASLRQELSQALAEGKGQEVQFKLGPIELDLQLQVENKVGANAGIKWWLISLGGSGEHSSGRTHHLKLTLQPLGPDGAELQVSQERERRGPGP